jgi:P27 family predicted phage terminase small subunit
MMVMARPAKAINTRVGHATKEEIGKRRDTEATLRGDADEILPPAWLNEGQRAVFQKVLEEMASSGTLGNLDVYVLTQFSVVTERMFAIAEILNDLSLDTKTRRAYVAERNAYVSDFWRGINELSLSPQARAKIGSLTLAKNEDEKDPLKRLLAGKG